MRLNLLGTVIMAAVLTGASLNAAPTGGKGIYPDDQISKAVLHQIRMYPYYSVWDNVNFRVREGQVELLGQVSQPVKKADLGRIVEKVPGVKSLTNDLEVLPLSSYDDQLRLQVARAIFRDTSLSRYAWGPVPPIHIIVRNGHVTLEGVVNNEMDKNLAGIRANLAGLSFGQVVNNLRVEDSKARRG